MQGPLIVGCVVLVSPMIAGCACGIGFPPDKVLRATIVDSETLAPLRNVSVSVTTMTAGDRTGSGGVRRGGAVDIQPDGSFELTILSFGSGDVCTSLLNTSTITSNTVPDFPPPDKIEVIVERDGCEQRIVIEMNAETVVDLAFPDGVIELIDPILVPACPESPDTGTATAETQGGGPSP